jgi:hypothetical protein
VAKANDELKSGAGLPERDPVLVYRNLFATANLRGAADAKEAFDKLLTALHHRVKGNKSFQLKYNQQAVDYFKGKV